MAITILKEPSGIYPAYNDSFIEFTSSLTGTYKAEVIVLPRTIFKNSFTIFPDLEGKFLFNLKEVVKVMFNTKGFEDFNFFEGGFSKSISGLYLLQSVTIEAFSLTNSESLSMDYEFFKSVKQIDEKNFDNPFQLLTKSENGIDYFLTYFEGFPFHFDIQRVVYEEGKTIKIKNTNTNIFSPSVVAQATGAFRFNIDSSDSQNWTSGGFLPLTVGLNKLEIYENNEFKTNLFLNKKKKCSGVYLKWWNTEGGFSHWLFDEFFSEKIQGKDIDLINSSFFNNVGNLDSDVRTIGKQASRTLKIKTRCNEEEAKVLKSLIYSPSIKMYSSKEANVKGYFFNVQVEETFESKNKKGNQDFSFTVQLPQIITALL